MLDLPIVAFVQFVTKVKLQQSLYWPITGQSGFQEVEAPRFSDSPHEGGQVVSPAYCPPLLPRINSWHSFLSGPELTLGPLCGLLDYVKEKL